jgi:hypothetical protein
VFLAFSSRAGEQARNLAEDILLGDDFIRQLMSVGEVDLLIGIPSYNSAITIAQTVRAIEESVHQNFVRDRIVIVNVDGGSTDNTTEVFLESDRRKAFDRRGLTSLRTIHRVSWQYGKTPSLGMAVRTIVAATDLLRARSCAVVSSTTIDLTASWVTNLLRPVHKEKFEYVSPLYARNRYEGLLSRNLLYPMVRAIFGLRMREVYSSEWAFSGRLAAHYLDQDVWAEEPVRARPEGWLAITAMCSGYACCQSFLGQKGAPTVGGVDTVEAIRQTVGNLFWCMERYQEHWLDRVGSQPVPTFGPEHEILNNGAPSNPEKIFELFRTGVAELEPVLASILTQETHRQLNGIASEDAEKFRFGCELLVRALYEFAASYHHAVINRDHIVQALVPLYRGRLYSYLLQHAHSSVEEMQADSELLCLEFERQKPYLIEKWNAKS